MLYLYVCLYIYIYTFEKGINPAILPPAAGKYSGSLGSSNCLREGKL